MCPIKLISSILSLASTAVGATTGNTSDAVAAGQASENAVENNFFELLVDPDNVDYLVEESLKPPRRDPTPAEIANGVGYAADAIVFRTPAGRLAAAAGATSIFTDIISIFTSNDGSSETTAKALFWSTITPFGLNKTGDFSKAATTRIGTLISYDVKQNNEKGAK